MNSWGIYMYGILMVIRFVLIIRYTICIEFRNGDNSIQKIIKGKPFEKKITFEKVYIEIGG